MAALIVGCVQSLVCQQQEQNDLYSTAIKGRFMFYSASYIMNRMVIELWLQDLARLLHHRCMASLSSAKLHSRAYFKDYKLVLERQNFVLMVIHSPRGFSSAPVAGIQLWKGEKRSIFLVVNAAMFSWECVLSH